MSRCAKLQAGLCSSGQLSGAPRAEEKQWTADSGRAALLLRPRPGQQAAQAQGIDRVQLSSRQEEERPSSHPYSRGSA